MISPTRARHIQWCQERVLLQKLLSFFFSDENLQGKNVMETIEVCQERTAQLSDVSVFWKFAALIPELECAFPFISPIEHIVYNTCRVYHFKQNRSAVPVKEAVPNLDSDAHPSTTNTKVRTSEEKLPMNNEDHWDSPSTILEKPHINFMLKLWPSFSSKKNTVNLYGQMETLSYHLGLLCCVKCLKPKELLKVFQHQLLRRYSITPKMKSFVRDFVPKITTKLGDLLWIWRMEKGWFFNMES